MKTALSLSIDPKTLPRRNSRWRVQTVAERLWSHVDKSGGCWLWTGYRNRKGYGVIGLDDGRASLAHRVSWALVNGTIPAGLLVLHSRECVSRACVRPDHLRLGDQLENMADMVALRRQNKPQGAKCGGSRLKAEQVLDIRVRALCGEPTMDIARRYGIGRTTTRNVILGRTWHSVESTESLRARGLTVPCAAPTEEERAAKERERFEALTSPEPNTGCWLWLGWVSPRGTGLFGRHEQAHRAAWRLWRGGPPAAAMKVIRRCRGEACVNPAYLALVTHGESLRRPLPPTCPRGHTEFRERRGSRECIQCGRDSANRRYRERRQLQQAQRHAALAVAQAEDLAGRARRAEGAAST